MTEQVRYSMAVVNIHEAKTQLSRLLARVEGGEEIIIARAGRAIARLIPMESAPTQRQPGSAHGLFTVPDDFDAPLPYEIVDAFES